MVKLVALLSPILNANIVTVSPVSNTVEVSPVTITAEERENSDETESFRVEVEEAFVTIYE